MKRVQSHPVWVRGLKHEPNKGCGDCSKSHPVWVRGLKQKVDNIACYQWQIVAPRVGAWIETSPDLNGDGIIEVAPRVGAWIETCGRQLAQNSTSVAPRVGAWIETTILQNGKIYLIGRTPCGCVD